MKKDDFIKYIAEEQYDKVDEIKAYFDISHYYQLVILSIDDISIALEVWIKGILPILLLRHGIDLEEWDRICSLADSIKTIEQELSQDWERFLEKIVRHGLVDNEIEIIIDEAKIHWKKSER